LKLLLDEMYPPALAEALRADDIPAVTLTELGLAGSADADVFAAAIADGYTLLTENVADFTSIPGEHLAAGGHHPGVLIALSSRFSRRPARIATIAVAISAIADQSLGDRTIYLQAPERAG
jgi:predicted nuclease of predicted toxin-antitoxin system